MQLSHLTARSLMSRDVACVGPEQSLAAAAALMAERKIRHLPVVHHGSLVGLLSHRDVLAAQRSASERARDGGPGELELKEPVAHAMTRRVFAVAPETPAIEVARTLFDRGIGCAPVVDADRRVIGILTETDFLDLVVRVLRHLPPLAVDEIMTRSPVTIRAERPLAEAETDMLLRRVRHLPVVDQQSRLVGLVTHRDVLRWRGSVLEATDAFRPHLRVSDAMTRSVVTVNRDTPAELAARTMLQHGFGCTPVVDGDALTGIVTATDFLDRLVRVMAADEVRMSWRDVPVHYYMRSPAHTVSADAHLDVAAQLLGRPETTCLVVMDRGRVVGLVSRTDLVDQSRAPGETLLPLDPEERVASRMTRGVVQIDAASPLIDACHLMIEREVHQVAVAEGAAVVGVLSRSDAIAAVRDLRLDSRIGEVATSLAFTVGREEPLRLARSLLEAADVSTVLVMDGRFPVGVFGKREALLAAEWGPESPVGYAMSEALLALPADLPIHHAAAQMVATGAPLVVVLRDGVGTGILTATDLIDALARLAPAEQRHPGGMSAPAGAGVQVSPTAEPRP